MYIRQTKNDSVNSFIIAQIMSSDEYSPTGLAEKNIIALRQFSSLRLLQKELLELTLLKMHFLFKLSNLYL